MAARFRCDPQVAGEVSRELSGIRSALAASGRIADGSEQSTGSAKVGGALGRFFADSSDSRENMDALLERAAGLLQGLAEGTTAVDRGLADSLEPPPGQAVQPGQPVQPGQAVQPGQPGQPATGSQPAAAAPAGGPR